MKKLMILVMVLTVGLAHAQRGGKGERSMKDVTPEQIASIQSKKMTLALDLDNKQQSEVEKVLLSNAKDRKANKMTREEREKLSAEQKIAMREKALDQKIAMKRKMKSILNVEQYDRWEKMMAKRAKGKRKGKAERRRGNRND